ncbi:hypothetical protein RchiOBHm_Chr6g0287401 [Rosa chinensis]|uniref:Uncharacterized protein n=1 Tax=Rosa chinensis TaxID=74649 RepID=A0A2P6PV31_ROSCH|nr:hypothetical protein RchiOBHm_Chr6g0287401 [Rosa chinensis]
MCCKHLILFTTNYISQRTMTPIFLNPPGSSLYKDHNLSQNIHTQKPKGQRKQKPHRSQLPYYFKMSSSSRILLCLFLVLLTTSLQHTEATFESSLSVDEGPWGNVSCVWGGFLASPLISNNTQSVW